MDIRSELARERATLAKADVDLREGQARVDQQEALLADLRDAGAEAGEAERLLRLLRGTMEQWWGHRALIQQRIVYLEAKAAFETRTSASLGAET